MCRRSVSSWVSPGPRVPMAPSWPPGGSTCPAAGAADTGTGPAPPGAVPPPGVRARWAKISRIRAARSSTWTPSSSDSTRCWEGTGVIHHHHVRPHGPTSSFTSAALPSPMKVRGSGRPCSGTRCPRTRPRSLQQIGQLLHGGVVGVFLGGQAVGVQAHQHRPVFRLLCLCFPSYRPPRGPQPRRQFSSVLPQSPQ